MSLTSQHALLMPVSRERGLVVNKHRSFASGLGRVVQQCLKPARTQGPQETLHHCICLIRQPPMTLHSWHLCVCICSGMSMHAQAHVLYICMCVCVCVPLNKSLQEATSSLTYLVLALLCTLNLSRLQYTSQSYGVFDCTWCLLLYAIRVQWITNQLKCHDCQWY